MQKLTSFLSGKKTLFLILLITISFLAIPFSQINAVYTGTGYSDYPIENDAVEQVDAGSVGLNNIPAALSIALGEGVINGSFQVAAYSAKLLSFVLTDIVSKNITTDASFTSAWKTARDLGNMVIVLVFVVIGIATALRIQNYAAKKLLFPLIVVAILINFSGLFCGLIIDAANITMTGMGGASNGGMPIKLLYDMSGQSFTMIGFKLQGGANFSGYANVLGYCILFGLIYLGMAFTFLYLSIILIARYAILIFLYILSPLAFALMTFPATQKVWSEWKDNFLKWAFVGVFGTLVLTIGSSLSMNGTTFSTLFIQTIVFLMFIFIGFKMTAQQTGLAQKVADSVSNLAKSGGRLAMGAAGASAIGAAKIADRLTGNRASTGMQNLKTGYGNALERAGLRKIGSTAGANNKAVDDASSGMATEYAAAKAAAAKGDKSGASRMARIEQLAQRGRGTQGAAAMKALTTSGNLRKAFTDKSGNFDTNRAISRLSYAEAAGATGLKKEAVKADYQLAAPLNPDQVTNVMNRNPGWTHEEAVSEVNRGQLSSNLPNMSNSDLGNINHKDLQGPEGFAFIEQHMTPSTVDKMRVTAGKDLRDTLIDHANDFDAAEIAATTEKEKAKHRKMAESLRRLR